MPDPTYPNNAVCDLFQCNLDPTGLYTVYFNTIADRDNAFSQAGHGDTLVTSILSLTNFSYLAKDNIIKVDYNKDYLDSLGINYCRFKNPSFYTAYKYAFVDSIEYVAPHTSALHIRIDSFITYQHEILHNQQFVLRRTVTGTEDAAIKYGYTIPEQISGMNYISDKVAYCVFDTSTNFFTYFKLGILAKPFPLNNTEGWIDISTSDPNFALKERLNSWCAHMLNGYPTGCNIFVAPDRSMLTTVSDLVNALGSEIIGTFWIHDDLDNVHLETYQHAFGETATIHIQDVVTEQTKYGLNPVTIKSSDVKDLSITTVSGQSNYGKKDTLDGYKPINGKCFTYPYNYIVASDNNGTIINYRYEDFANGEPDFDCKFIASTDNAIVLIPKNYMGNNDTLDYSLFITGFPQSPYMSDNYAMYLGTHAAQTAVARYARYMDYGKSLINIGIAGYKASQAFESRMYATPEAEAEHKKEKGKALANLGESVSGLGNALNKSMQAIAQQADEYAVNVYNAGATSNMATLGYLGVVIYHKYLCYHDMERIDQYFSRYGYLWSKNEPLYFDSTNRCPDYNYIQTQGCNIEGQIPVEDKRKIEALFDAGITIWCNKNRYGMYADSTHPNKGNP